MSHRPRGLYNTEEVRPPHSFQPFCPAQTPSVTMKENKLFSDISKARFVSLKPSGEIGNTTLDSDLFETVKVGRCMSQRDLVGYLPNNEYYYILRNKKTDEHMRAIAQMDDNCNYIEAMHVLDSVEADRAAIKTLYNNHYHYSNKKVEPSFPTAEKTSLRDDEKNVFGKSGFTYSTKLKVFGARPDPDACGPN